MYRILHILTGKYVTVYTVPKQLCQHSDKKFIFIHPIYKFVFNQETIAEIKTKKEAEKVIQKVID